MWPEQEHSCVALARVATILALLVMASITLAQGDTWIRKRDMPTARLGLATSVVHGKIYAIGGYRQANAPGMRTVEEYDPATDTWTTKANMPTGRRQLATSVVNGKIYAIGGYVNFREPGLSTVEKYDPETNTWTTKAPMPTARLGLATSVVNGIIYAIGGATGGVVHSSVEEYDPKTNTWGSVAAMTGPRGGLSTSTVNGRIYAIGGTETTVIPHPGVSTVEEYTPPLASIHNLRLNSSFIRPGIDSLKIKCNVINPHLFDLQVHATIHGVDSTFIEKRPLYDDGLHWDDQPNDGLWGTPLAPLSNESEFLANVTVSKIDSANHVLHSALKRFTTIGPMVFADHTFIGSDIVPNPGDGMVVKLTLKNEGVVATASNVTAELTALDSLSFVSGQANPSYGNIPPQESAVTAGFYRLNINEIITSGAEMHFRVDIASNGSLFWSDTFKIDIVTGVADPSGEQDNPTEFALHQNYPNPFNPETAIEYSIPKRDFASLKVYDLLGNEIQTLVNELVNAGAYSVTFDARKFSSGLYSYKLEAGEFVKTKKMLLIR